MAGPNSHAMDGEGRVLGAPAMTMTMKIVGDAEKGRGTYREEAGRTAELGRTSDTDSGRRVEVQVQVTRDGGGQTLLRCG